VASSLSAGPFGYNERPDGSRPGLRLSYRVDRRLDGTFRVETAEARPQWAEWRAVKTPDGYRAVDVVTSREPSPEFLQLVDILKARNP